MASVLCILQSLLVSYPFTLVSTVESQDVSSVTYHAVSVCGQLVILRSSLHTLDSRDDIHALSLRFLLDTFAELRRSLLDRA